MAAIKPTTSAAIAMTILFMMTTSLLLLRSFHGASTSDAALHRLFPTVRSYPVVRFAIGSDFFAVPIPVPICSAYLHRLCEVVEHKAEIGPQVLDMLAPYAQPKQGGGHRFLACQSGSTLDG